MESVLDPNPDTTKSDWPIGFASIGRDRSKATPIGLGVNSKDEIPGRTSDPSPLRLKSPLLRKKRPEIVAHRSTASTARDGDAAAGGRGASATAEGAQTSRPKRVSVRGNTEIRGADDWPSERHMIGSGPILVSS